MFFSLYVSHAISPLATVSEEFFPSRQSLSAGHQILARDRSQQTLTVKAVSDLSSLPLLQD